MTHCSTEDMEMLFHSTFHPITTEPFGLCIRIRVKKIQEQEELLYKKHRLFQNEIF